MASPGPEQPTYHWPTQTYHKSQIHQTPDQYPQLLSKFPPKEDFTSPVPFLAELPAPLPPAPSTATSSEQLKEDETLARKLQQLDISHARRNSSGAEGYPQRHLTGMAQTSLWPSAPLVHHRSAQSLRPHSQSLPYNSPICDPKPWILAAYQANPSLLPEVVEEPKPVQVILPDDLPIPVIQERITSKPLIVLYHSMDTCAYLEQHLQVPYPPQWALPPTVSALYAYRSTKITPGSTWLDTPDSLSWRTVRPIDHAYNPTLPSYTFKFKTTGGNFRSPKFSWIMTCPENPTDATQKGTKTRPSAWAYELKMDTTTHMRKSESLSHGKARAILTIYVHASNYDSLRFIGPDGRAYMWVSSGKVSSIDGSRYDTIRHALFVAVGNNPDPLFGQIVADHTFWDGFVDHNEVHVGVQCDGCQSEHITGLRWKCRSCARHDVCESCRALASNGQLGPSILPTCDFSVVNLPDEVLYLRSPTVDFDLVAATLQVLKDWEKDTLRREKRSNIKGFLVSEEAARRCDLGVMSYWKSSDWDSNGAKGQTHGTRVRAEAMARSLEQTTRALGRIGNATSTKIRIGTVAKTRDVTTDHHGSGGSSGGI